MKTLAELARIVERVGDNRQQVFLDNKRRKELPVTKLYRGVLSGKYESDDVAALEVFSAGPQSPKYATAKSRLKRRLLNSLVLLNLKKAGYSTFGQAQFTTYRALFFIQALQILGARRVAMRIAQRQYVLSSEFHLTHVQLELSQFLRFDSSLKGLGPAFESWSLAARRHIADLAAENLALEYYGELELNQNKKQVTADELRVKAIKYAGELEQIRCNTFNFQTTFNRLRYFELDLLGRYEEVTQVCDEAINYFRGLEQFKSHVVVSEFAFRKLDACLKLRDLARGEEAYLTASNLVKQGSNNWFALQSYYCLLLLHATNFQTATRVIEDVRSHQRFEHLPDPMKEIWNIYDLHALYATDRLEEEGGKITKAKPSQRLEALLNVAPTLSQDKQGHKVSLLILHILYLLEIGDFNGIIDRMEALRLYRARYLKAAQFPKTASFFKLLQIMENNSFAYKLVKEKGEKEYEKLIASTENQEEINEGLQILPYDWLWLKILDRLKEYEAKFAKRGF